MTTQFVPLGVDCGAATTLKELNLRQHALPFDWVVTWRPGNLVKHNDTHAYFSTCKFVHHDITQTNVRQTLQKRWQRLQNMIHRNSDKLVFVHKGHAQHHHREEGFAGNIDASDMYGLADWLDRHHPNYQIWSWHCCDLCPFSSEYHHPKVQHFDATLYVSQAQVDVQQTWRSYYDIFHRQVINKVQTVDRKTI